MPICLAVCKTKMKVQYIGKENVPKEGGFILACNHSSNFDPIAPVSYTHLDVYKRQAMLRDKIQKLREGK